MALALYRRYRPDTFDGIIGQEQVTAPLSHALDTGRLTHAYLFSGPRGCGKTSSARILARCINCEKGPTSHPCGECDSCKDLATGGPGSIDVVEIDAASHNGVDDARELRERAAFAPARDRYKIFILDEAHMVTQQGFNALLKIVEEPPEHVMFIFATTEPDKVISTIRSRTHHYPFRLVPEEVMGPYLEHVCEQEKIETEPGVLGLVMKAGGGSVRDTLSVLDQLMVGAVDGEIAYDSAVSLLGFTPDALIGEAIDAIIDSNGEALYGVIEKVVVGGFEPRRFVEDLLARVRDLLVLTLGGEQAADVLGDETSSLDVSDLRRQSEALGLSELTAMAEIIDTALAEMVGATSTRMRLELLAARLLAGRQSGYAPKPARTMDGSAGQGTNGGVFGTSESHAAGAGGAGRGASSGANQPSRGRFIGRRSSATVSGSNRAGNARENSAQNGGVQANGSQGVNLEGGRIESGSVSQRPPETPSHVASESGRAEGMPGSPSADSASSVTEQQGTRLAKISPAEKAVRQKVGQIDPGASVDEKWDDVVRALPEGVREYVVREKVPTVALATNNAGRSRLSMTFDTALSQHAFALAIASDAENEGRKASWVVLETVHVVFGHGTTIAPTAVAANGEHVTSTKRMKPEELAQVKRKIAMAKTGLTVASGIVSPNGKGSEPKEHKKADDSGSKDSEDPTHVATPIPAAPHMDGSDGSATPDDEDFDPRYQQPAGNETSSGNTEGAENNGVAAGVGGAATESLNKQAFGGGNTSGAAGGAGNSDAGHHKKHVDVPVDDGVDPWDTPLAAPTAETGSSARSPQGVQNAVPRVNANAGFAVDHAAKPNSGVTSDVPYSQSEVHAPKQPEVAPDDDEYSIDDRSLGDSAISVDDLTKMFEVKRVEEFAPDDPKNPKNAKPAPKMQNEQRFNG